MFVEMDKLLDEIVEQLEVADRLRKSGCTNQTILETIKICEQFNSSFDDDQVSFFLNQFKLWKKDYSSNQRRLIDNFIFFLTGEGFLQDKPNGDKWSKKELFQLYDVIENLHASVMSEHNKNPQNYPN